MDNRDVAIVVDSWGGAILDHCIPSLRILVGPNIDRKVIGENISDKITIHHRNH